MPRGIPNKKQDEESTELSTYELIFLQSIRDFFPQFRLHSDKMLTSKIGRGEVASHALELHAFIQFGAGELRRNEELALTNQLLKNLALYLKDMQIPVTLNTLLNNLGLLETSTDKAFPGYIQSHLLKYIIMPMDQNK